jgi:hypothetical protein
VRVEINCHGGKQVGFSTNCGSIWVAPPGVSCHIMNAEPLAATILFCFVEAAPPTRL